MNRERCDAILSGYYVINIVDMMSQIYSGYDVTDILDVR